MVRTCGLLAVFLLSFSLIAIAAEDRSLAIRKKPVANERRVALIIGNNVYQDAPLKNPVNDADAMSRVLRDTGFDVILVKNADRRRMFASIKEFGKKLKKSDVGLFYYAGHGVQVDNTNYLLPVDLKGSDLQDMDDLRYNAVPLNEIMDQIRDASTNNIIILDACRDNPFLAKLNRSASRGLAKVVTPSSTSILYSTDPGNTASDGVRGENGVFTNRLVESIQKEGLELVDIMREVAVNVSNDTNGAQRPIFDGVISSKFYFRAIKTLPQAVAIAPITVDPRVVDLRYWESAEKTNDISAYRSYLKKFPAGDFVDIAVNKIQLLEQAKMLGEAAAKADLERKAKEAAEQSSLAKERTEQDRRMRDIEAKIQQSEERARQAEERAAIKEASLKQPQPDKQQIAMVSKVDSYNMSTAAKEPEKLFTATKLTMQDNKTGLMWVRDGGLSGHTVHRQATSFIDKLNSKNYGGYDDWRLPTRGELETLVKYAKNDGWGDKEGHYVSDYLVLKGFKKVKPEHYMTDQFAYYSFEAVRMWSGNFETLDNSTMSQKFVTYVLPVRSPLEVTKEKIHN